VSTAVDRIILKGRAMKVAGLGLMRPSVVMSGMVSIIRVDHARAVVTGMDVSAGCEAWFFLT
jgi:hypothetical protein